MEVNGLTANTIPQHHNYPVHVNEGTDPEDQDQSLSLPQRNGGNKIDTVTMDLDEMKNFLFMMIRGGNILIEPEENRIGRIVNKLA